jgi:hypothetical protein
MFVGRFNFVPKVEIKFEQDDKYWVRWRDLTISGARSCIGKLRDRVKESDIHGAFEMWGRKDEIAVHVPKETILKEMAAENE